MQMVSKHLPKLVTATLVLVTLVVASILYSRYSTHPWTRDAQVRADLVKIAPRVQGYLVRVAVKDNQFVHKGDLLFQIDPTSFQLAVDEAKVELDQAREDVAALESAVVAAEAGIKQSNAAVSSAESKIKEAQASVAAAESTVKQAESGVTSAQADVKQNEAMLDEAQREATRAKRLADQKAGSVEEAQAKEAAVAVHQAQLQSAEAKQRQAEAVLDQSRAGLGAAKAKLLTAKNGLAEAQAAVATATAKAEQARANLGVPGEANVRIRSAKVHLDETQLKLSWTNIYAPADGYITNMDLLESAFVFPGIPFALFVDAASFRVDAYFEETKVKYIHPGDHVTVTLMGHHDRQLEGEVDSIGYAINLPKLANTSGPANLVPTIEPTFEWIRLAQRVPVRIRFKSIPDDLQLISGTTASVAIKN